MRFRLPWPLRRNSAPSPAPPPAQHETAAPAQVAAPITVDPAFAASFRTRGADRDSTPVLGAWGGLGETARFAVSASRFSDTLVTQRFSDDVAPRATALGSSPEAFIGSLASLASYADPSGAITESGNPFADTLPVSRGDLFAPVATPSVPALPPSTSRAPSLGAALGPSRSPARPTAPPSAPARRTTPPTSAPASPVRRSVDSAPARPSPANPSPPAGRPRSSITESPATLADPSPRPTPGEPPLTLDPTAQPVVPPPPPENLPFATSADAPPPSTPAAPPPETTGQPVVPPGDAAPPLALSPEADPVTAPSPAPAPPGPLVSRTIASPSATPGTPASSNAASPQPPASPFEEEEPRPPLPLDPPAAQRAVDASAPTPDLPLAPSSPDLPASSAGSTDSTSRPPSSPTPGAAGPLVQPSTAAPLPDAGRAADSPGASQAPASPFAAPRVRRFAIGEALPPGMPLTRETSITPSAARQASGVSPGPAGPAPGTSPDRALIDSPPPLPLADVIDPGSASPSPTSAGPDLPFAEPTAPTGGAGLAGQRSPLPRVTTAPTPAPARRLMDAPSSSSAPAGQLLLYREPAAPPLPLDPSAAPSTVSRSVAPGAPPASAPAALPSALVAGSAPASSPAAPAAPALPLVQSPPATTTADVTGAGGLSSAPQSIQRAASLSAPGVSASQGGTPLVWRAADTAAAADASAEATPSAVGQMAPAEGEKPGEPDLDKLADKVWQRVRRTLQLERERRKGMS